MTATPARMPLADRTAAARQWVERHYDELLSRAAANAGHGDPTTREEIIAETLAMAYIAAHNAAGRGRLERLTPFWLVVFAGRRRAAGRRAAGQSSTDAMAEATRVKRGVRVLSLARDLHGHNSDSMQLGDVLADRRAEDPAERVRRDHDYDAILDQAAVSRKGRRTFAYLAETHASGKQTALAEELGVTPGRICQLKGELADALAAHDYRGPLGPRPAPA